MKGTVCLVDPAKIILKGSIGKSRLGMGSEQQGFESLQKRAMVMSALDLVMPKFHPSIAVMAHIFSLQLAQLVV